MQGMAEPVDSAAYGGGRTQAQKFQCRTDCAQHLPGLAARGQEQQHWGLCLHHYFSPVTTSTPPKGRVFSVPMEDGSGVLGMHRWGFCVGKHPRAVSEVNPNLVRSMVGLHRLLRKWNSGYISLRDVSLSVFPFHPFVEYTERCYITQLK